MEIGITTMPCRQIQSGVWMGSPRGNKRIYRPPIPALRPTPVHLILLIFLSCALLCSCGSVVGGNSPREERTTRIERVYHHPKYLEIPASHLPPPGECKIWLPGVPPGQQGPPGDCDELASQMPLGAWLVHKDRNAPDVIEVFVYHEQRPGRVVIIRYYSADTGEFLRDSPP